MGAAIRRLQEHGTPACRIIDCRLEPMNVSLHAISGDVRRRLIGAHAARGIEVLEKLMNAGIEIHAQIVLCPVLRPEVVEVDALSGTDRGSGGFGSSGTRWEGAGP